MRKRIEALHAAARPSLDMLPTSAMLRLFALALAFGLPLAAAAQPILYVDADADGADDGSS